MLRGRPRAARRCRPCRCPALAQEAQTRRRSHPRGSRAPGLGRGRGHPGRPRSRFPRRPLGRRWPLGGPRSVALAAPRLARAGPSPARSASSMASSGSPFRPRSASSRSFWICLRPDAIWVCSCVERRRWHSHRWTAGPVRGAQYEGRDQFQSRHTLGIPAPPSAAGESSIGPMTDPKAQAAQLAAGAVELLPEGRLAEQLAEGRPLRVKLGIDPDGARHPPRPRRRAQQAAGSSRTRATRSC